MLDEKYTGNGKVVLLAGGGKIYTDIAARFVRSERSLEEIVARPIPGRSCAISWKAGIAPRWNSTFSFSAWKAIPA